MSLYDRNSRPFKELLAQGLEVDSFGMKKRVDLKFNLQSFHTELQYMGVIPREKKPNINTRLVSKKNVRPWHDFNKGWITLQILFSEDNIFKKRVHQAENIRLL